jgi:hypothetical protein
MTIGTFILENPGDYIVWGPASNTPGKAEADSIMLTIRWPSS